jgi:hypothetical protein
LNIRKITAMTIATGFAMSLISSSSANAAAAQDMDFLIQPSGGFVGLQIRGVLDETGFDISEIESDDYFEGFTGDALDGWGDIFFSIDDWASKSELVFDSRASCTVTADGSAVDGSDYVGNQTILSSSVIVDCPVSGVTVGSGDIDFRVVQEFEGSYFATRIYAAVSSGTPDPFKLSVGGNLGSDDDTEVQDQGTSGSWDYVITGGDDGDPTVGYRSETSFNFDDEPGFTYVVYGDDNTWLSTASTITAPSTSALVYEVETWFVDYSDMIPQSETVEYTASFAAAQFGTPIPTLLPTDDSGPYSGPIISDIGADNVSGAFAVAAGEQVKVAGSRLSSVSKAIIEGKDCEIISTSDDEIVIKTPQDLNPGLYDLRIFSSIGNLNYINAFLITEAVVSEPSYGTMSAWTVNQDDGTAKVYVKFPTIGEKVRIGHQTGGSGSYETTYVKTLDSETHEDLTVNAEGSYIVRTIDLVDGTNRIRVTVGDSTEVQVRYNE